MHYSISLRQKELPILVLFRPIRRGILPEGWRHCSRFLNRHADFDSVARQYETSIFLFLLIVLCGSSISFWQLYRFNVAKVPISVPDIVIIAYGIYGVFKWLGAKRRFRIGSIGRLVIIWFLYQSVVGISTGLINGNPPYAIFQEYRVVFYAAIAYFATLSVFRLQRHLSVVIWGILVAGVVASTWQLWISYSGRDILQDNIAYLTADYIGRTLRDVNIPLYFAGPALMALVAAQFEAPEMLGRWRFVLWGLAPILLISPLLSMTRTVWIAISLSALMVIAYVTSYSYRHKRLSVFVLICVLFVMTLLVANRLLQVFLPGVYEGAKVTVQNTLSLSDRGFVDRLNAPSQVFLYFSENGWRYITGLGFGNMWSGATSLGPLIGLHNVYLAYLVFGGLPGLLIFLWVWARPIPVYYRLLFKYSDRQISPRVRIYILAIAVNWVMLTVIMTAMPPHWAEAAFFGINMAIITILDSVLSAQIYKKERQVPLAKRAIGHENAFG